MDVMVEGGSGAVASRRSTWRLVRALVRNPLEALPPEIYSAPMVVSRVAGAMRVHVADPELIHAALVEHADCLVKSDDMRRALGPALGDGLLTADGGHGDGSGGRSRRRSSMGGCWGACRR